MHSRVLAERNEQSVQRIEGAATRLCGLLGFDDLTDLLTPEPARDSAVSELYRREAVAVFLEAVVKQLSEKQSDTPTPPTPAVDAPPTGTALASKQRKGSA